VSGPAEGAVHHLSGAATWRQSFAAFEEGTRTIALRSAPLQAAA